MRSLSENDELIAGQVEAMGTKLDQKSQIGLILNFLPYCFSLFKMNYNMNKLDLTPVELMHEHHSAEESLSKLDSAYFTQSRVKSKGKLKDSNKNKKNVVVPVTNSTAMKKPKGKCFKCEEKGH